jgi:hypothetical protein
MEIKKLLATPEMIRNSDDSGYMYPDAFQNSIFELNNNYVLFQHATYEVIPKQLFDKLITNLSNDTKSNNDITNDDVQLLINETLSNSFNNVNRVIDNLTDKFSSCIELKDLQKFRDQVELTINQLFAEKTAIAENFDPEDILHELHLLKTQSTPDIDIVKVKDIITEELRIVRENLPMVVETIMSKLNYISSVPEQKTTLSLGQLVTLKEAGYTVQEINELKQNGLI